MTLCTFYSFSLKICFLLNQIFFPFFFSLFIGKYCFQKCFYRDKSSYQTFKLSFFNQIQWESKWIFAAHYKGLTLESPASCSSGNSFVSGAEGLGFKFWAGQIEHSVTNGSPPLRHYFKRSCVVREQ